MDTTQTPTNHPLRNAVIRLAGQSQDGIQSIGAFLAQLAGSTAQDVMTYMTIPSTISGGASIFQVHLGSGKVLHPGDEADTLVAFYQDSYDQHLHSLRDGGICFYDSDKVEELKEERDIRHIGIPFTSASIEAIGGSAKDRGKNIFVLGMLCAVYKLDRDRLVEIISRKFGSKSEDVLRNALLAFDAGYAWSVHDIEHMPFAPGENEEANRLSTDGNTMLTLGLIAGGCRFGAGYPITPWSSIMEGLRSELPKYGGMFIQSEDELAAIATAIGAAYSGHLAITGSSGPGLSLKSEALGYACMAEIPLIVVNIQRGGPSTGLPTSVEQSDLMQAIYGSHGDAPRVVLAPRDVEDCFYTAIEACRIAREYSTPVIILSDQAIATRIEAFPEPDLEKHWREPELDLSERGADFKPYPLDKITRHSPPGARSSEGKYPVVTGLEHDEWGHPSSNPQNHAAMTAKRREKLVRLANALPAPDFYGDEQGDILFIGWGSTYGPILEATDQLRANGTKTGSLHLRHIHPLRNGLGDIFHRYTHIIVPEMNDAGVYGYGQLASLLRSVTCNPNIQSLNKVEGITFRVKEIVEGATTILSKA
ncbi:2-oxoacid:acceptor oxidoreductase subunit alpha [Haloferula rosea]|uniref:2-oxoacid:acceptor oxidoreductase subunit alpha n=1 Tax=Haloferula rosea TaxID=490093 RepID=A0A934RHS7_9BACT|nr:2-oxoacid:acceptor oxidoreductase subunit alpha [Haloferula rosea]MBK1828771.1 2-oxoacid:acceptor oxidoreductase subunit alpha [Haloferula rosea]